MSFQLGTYGRHDACEGYAPRNASDDFADADRAGTSAGFGDEREDGLSEGGAAEAAGDGAADQLRKKGEESRVGGRGEPKVFPTQARWAGLGEGMEVTDGGIHFGVQGGLK